ncbi:hypothetical protein BGX27_010197 [Mortierella sp. AM989]|nr:hypothetical protein BGX27_010197 [Mortierella sp. AM989]
MHFKKSSLILLAVVLVASSTVSAQRVLDNILPVAQAPQDPQAPSPSPSESRSASSSSSDAPPPSSSTAAPTSVAPSIPPVISSQTASSTSSSAAPTHRPNPGPKVPTSSSGATGTTLSATSSAASPTNSNNKSEAGGGAKLATAGIVVGSIVVATAIGIWVFRKWKLSIRGDDYQDYPRSYEPDTVYLRNLDQPAEPAASKSSPYSAQASLPAEDQYYDSNYPNDQGAYAHRDGYAGYDQAGYDHPQAGYDHQGYTGHGYETPYNPHNDYAESQVGGYAQSQVSGSGGGGGGGGGYAASNVGGGYAASNVGGGYAASNVGGGYQHQGYDEYGRR